MSRKGDKVIVGSNVLKIFLLVYKLDGIHLDSLDFLNSNSYRGSLNYRHLAPRLSRCFLTTFQCRHFFVHLYVLSKVVSHNSNRIYFNAGGQCFAYKGEVLLANFKWIFWIFNLLAVVKIICSWCSGSLKLWPSSTKNVYVIWCSSKNPVLVYPTWNPYKVYCRQWRPPLYGKSLHRAWQELTRFGLITTNWILAEFLTMN